MASKGKKLSSAADIFSREIEGVIRKIPMDEITPSETQPRLDKDLNISSLAESLKNEGLLQPIVVTKDENTNGYVIIAGERRYRAAQSLSWSDIECRILKKNTKEKYKLAVIENLQRENLNAFEEAIAYKKLKNQFQYTDRQLSDIIGKSRNYISEILTIAEIPASYMEKAREKGIHQKNLLVQFAQAIKYDYGDEFLNSYQNGEISTVKKAKDYLKKVKSSQSVKFDEKPSLNDNNSETLIPLTETKAEWLNEKKLVVTVTFKKIPEFTFPLENLEKELSILMENALKKLS